VPEFAGVVVMFNIETAIEHWLQGGTVTVAGVIVTVGPAGKTLAVMGSGKLCHTLEAFMVIFDLEDPPGIIVSPAGFALSVKNDDTPCNRHPVSGCSSQPE